MFDSLLTYLDKLANIDDNAIWFEVIDRETQFEIIRLNTEDQLFDDGIDSLDRKIGEYSPLSVSIKTSKGQRTDHITLKDTGEFYQSFRVKVDKWGMFIAADDVKDDTVLTERYGIDILGLTEENTQVLINMIRQKYIKELHERLSY